MRTREKLEKEYFKNPGSYGRFASTKDEELALVMEVLLDIRELLTPQYNDFSYKQQAKKAEKTDY